MKKPAAGSPGAAGQGGGMAIEAGLVAGAPAVLALAGRQQRELARVL